VNVQLDLPESSWLSALLAGAGCLLAWLWYGPLFGRFRRKPVETDKSAAPWLATAIVYAIYFFALLTAADMVPQVLGHDPELSAAIRAALIAAAGLAFLTYASLTLTTEMALAEVAIVAGYNAVVFPIIILVVGLFG
jgi:hypothetical protein